jgi:hypothetical protein
MEALSSEAEMATVDVTTITGGGERSKGLDKVDLDPLVYGPSVAAGIEAEGQVGSDKKTVLLDDDHTRAATSLEDNNNKELQSDSCSLVQLADSQSFESAHNNIIKNTIAMDNNSSLNVSDSLDPSNYAIDRLKSAYFECVYSCTTDSSFTMPDASSKSAPSSETQTTIVSIYMYLIY